MIIWVCVLLNVIILIMVVMLLLIFVCYYVMDKKYFGFFSFFVVSECGGIKYILIEIDGKFSELDVNK